MKNWYRTAAAMMLCTSMLTACSTSPTQEQPCDSEPPSPIAAAPCDCPESTLPGEIIGEVEYALVSDTGPLQKARIDTGATTTSLGFHEVSSYERDGEKWVRFSVRDRLDGKVHTFERELVGTASIKRHGAEPVQRPVVKMRISIGDVSKEIEVTLADRNSFDYPVLIGRNFLDGNVLVDVSKRYIASGEVEE